MNKKQAYSFEKKIWLYKNAKFKAVVLLDFYH